MAKIINCLILAVACLLPILAKADSQVQVAGGCAPDRSTTLLKRDSLMIGAISYCDGGDAAVGNIALSFPASILNAIDFYFAGYPNGKSVRFELTNQTGETVPIPSFGTGDVWRPLNVALPENWSETDTLTLTAVDTSTAWSGWAGLAYGKRQAFTHPLINYLYFFAKALLICAMIVLPGIWWNSAARNKLPIGFLPIPGILLLAAVGLGLWALPAGAARAIRWALYLGFLLAGLDLLRRIALGLKNKTCRIFQEGKSAALIAGLITALVFLQALAIGVNPLPVAQEYASESMIPGRMIASPPDHLIPFQTAVYLYHQLDGAEQSKEYFGDWNITSRGPLAPLGINTLFHVFTPLGISPDINEPLSHRESWPLAANGQDIARIYGWAINALIVLGAFQLLSTLAVSGQTRKIALVWIALSPVVLINTVFLWPKLLTAYFFLLAVAALIERRPILAGWLTALAWLSHPVGALMIPALGLFILFMPRAGETVSINLRQWIRRSVPFLLGLALTMAPWLIYKAHLGYHDAFMTYVLAGGHGIERAADFQTWLSVRMSNFWLTLSPGAFFYSDNMQHWIYGPINDALRWSIQYAKTLPGNLGLSCFMVAYLALFSRQTEPVLQAIRQWILIAGFGVMLVFWGFSGDGLGRNSLEPLSILLIIFAAASKPELLQRMTILLPVLALESQWLAISGFVFAPGFAWNLMKVDAWLGIAANLLISLTLLFLCLRKPYQLSHEGQAIKQPITTKMLAAS